MASPINVYGTSKLAGEIFTENYSSKHYVIRVASLYGKAGASGKGGNFVNWVIDMAKRGETLRIVRGQYMSPTYTLDVAETLKSFLNDTARLGGLPHGKRGYCSWYDFAKTIFEILN